MSLEVGIEISKASLVVVCLTAFKGYTVLCYCSRTMPVGFSLTDCALKLYTIPQSIFFY